MFFLKEKSLVVVVSVEVWNTSAKKSIPPFPFLSSSVWITVGFSVENPQRSSRWPPFPQLCGELRIIPPIFPRGIHKERDNSFRRAWTFLSKAGVVSSVSSTFLMEWITVE